MIRERRSKEKLQQYYEKFITTGEIDPNVHPWVAESWKNSRKYGIRPDAPPQMVRLAKEELAVRRQESRFAIQYLDELYLTVRDYFSAYNLSLLLLDRDCYALKNYALPFFQKSTDAVEGARLSERDIGTSSISLAYTRQVPFLLFAPEMWLKEAQTGEACSTPIFVNREFRYILTIVAAEQSELPYNGMLVLLHSMRCGLENQLILMERLSAKHALLDALPSAAYYIRPDGQVAYANKLGRQRLTTAGGPDPADATVALDAVVSNFHHSPLNKGLYGVPSYNKEMTWLMPGKTYEDITTVVPLHQRREISGIAVISTPVEEIRNLAAHAISYKARYSLSSLTGISETILAAKEKAGRAARGQQHILLQGEPGIGKQRLAHGIHQASPRAAGPLIALHCGDLTPDELSAELFGTADGLRPGKLDLANGGTLFIDEVEKLGLDLAEVLLERFREKKDSGKPPDIRLIAACDSDLKRLTDKGLFHPDLYKILAKTVIRIPPLSARREDIPVLAEHILQELADQHHLPMKRLTQEARELLIGFDWPGNVKQLQETVEKAFFHCQGEVIDKPDLELPVETGPGKAWKEDKAIFVDAWKAAGGNISRLANMLGVSRVTLYRYLHKYGLEKE